MSRSVPLGFAEALGQSEVFLAFQENLSRAAKVDRPVLIVGERGTGKELAAGRLHYLSPRWERPLVALNCAALAPSLVESELFGHEAGAFTGAAARRPGRFEAADGGTLFLDEIANTPLQTQEKILRVVEYGTLERVGGTSPVEVDVRLVGATHADLLSLADEGRFKRDLLDRLSFDVLFVPPLRTRGDDVLLLANHFASRMALDLGRQEMPRFTPKAVESLKRHAWPGNVRELKNVIERAVYRATSADIDEIDFEPFRSPFSPLPSEPVVSIEEKPPPDAGAPRITVSFTDAVRDFEIALLKQALERAKFNQRQAAEKLQLTYHQFRGLYRKYSEFLL